MTTITDEQITALLEESSADGDYAQVLICLVARGDLADKEANRHAARQVVGEVRELGADCYANSAALLFGLIQDNAMLSAEDDGTINVSIGEVEFTIDSTPGYLDAARAAYSMTYDDARAECARVIADAQAQEEATSTEAYAVCDANGPISVRIPDEIYSGQWPMQAVAEWLAEHGEEAIESASTDLEDALEICWDGWDDSEISEALESAGFTGRPIDESSGSSGLPQVVAGGWWVWTRTARED